MHVEIKQRGARRAALHVQGLSTRAASPRPAFDRIGRELERQEAAWFRSHGEGSWSPLSVETETIKGPGEPLVASGRLRSSLTSHSAVEQTRSELRFGTDVPYARFHQYGTRSAPKRPPLVPASPRLRKMMEDEVKRHVVGNLTR